MQGPYQFITRTFVEVAAVEEPLHIVCDRVDVFLLSLTFHNIGEEIVVRLDRLAGVILQLASATGASFVDLHEDCMNL